MAQYLSRELLCFFVPFVVAASGAGLVMSMIAPNPAPASPISCSSLEHLRPAASVVPECSAGDRPLPISLCSIQTHPMTPVVPAARHPRQ